MVHIVAAHGDITLGLHLDKEELKREAKALCTDLLEGWRSVNPDDIEVRVSFRLQVPCLAVPLFPL